jgi:hypothetical protein
LPIQTCHDTGVNRTWSSHLPPVLPLIISVNGVVIRLFSMISTFGTPQDITTDEIQARNVLPADEETGLLLQALTE